MSLSAGQQEVLDLLEKGHSVFCTGPGGSGKSFLIKAIQAEFGAGVVITATTGMAAVQISGTTLHRFLAMPIGPVANIRETVARIERMFQVRRRIQNLRILVIDECSMLSPTDFAKADAILRGVRRSNQPFGGAQVVLLGDFFQLPPVNSDRAASAASSSAAKFVFQTSLWKDLLGKQWETKVVELEGSFRHAADPAYSELLLRAREGKLSAEDLTSLKSRVCRPSADLQPQPTILLPLVNQVSTINHEFLRRCGEPCTTIRPINGNTATGASPAEVENELAGLLRDCALEEPLQLCVGAVVMITANIDEDHVNGTRGVVESIETPVPTQKAHDLRTMHSDLYTLQYKRAPSTRPEDCPSAAYPATGLLNVTLRLENGTRYTVPWYRRARELAGGRGEVYTWIPPIKLAFAMTIHKGQGQTLESVRIGTRTIFEPGQAYVALSRCRTLEGLYLDDLDPSKVFADKAVLEFYHTVRLFRARQASVASAAASAESARPSKRGREMDETDWEIMREIDTMEREFESD